MVKVVSYWATLPLTRAYINPVQQKLQWWVGNVCDLIKFKPLEQEMLY
jgi:hypothetical protein